MEDISPLCGATDTPVTSTLDFRARMDPLACVLRRLRATETPENRSVFRIQECILLREQHTSFADRQPSSGGSNQRCAPLLTNLGNTIYRLKMLFIPYNVSDLGNQLCSDSSFFASLHVLSYPTKRSSPSISDRSVGFIESVHQIQFNSFVEFAQCYPVWVPYPVSSPTLTVPQSTFLWVKPDLNITEQKTIQFCFCSVRKIWAALKTIGLRE